MKKKIPHLDRRGFNLLLAGSLPAFYQGVSTARSSEADEPCSKQEIRLRDILMWNQEGISRSISSPGEWIQKRRAITQILFQFLGAFPSQRAALDSRIKKVERLNGYTRTKVEYNVEPHDKAQAYLLVPTNVTIPAPAALALHQTVPQGKDEPVGISGNPHMYYGLELVQKGYVVLAPDSITAGERVYPGAAPYVTAPFDASHPDWSAMGKMLWDHMRGVDYLLTLPVVDKKRIGVIGHSLGAYNAFFLAAFDERIKAAVSSCGLGTIAGAPNPFAWARKEWFVHFPKLRPYLEVGCTTPFDFHEVISLIAPRPFLTFSMKQDKIFPQWQGAIAMADQVRKVYGLWGTENAFRSVLKEGEHDFPPDSRVLAYEWIDRWLERKNDRIGDNSQTTHG